MAILRSLCCDQYYSRTESTQLIIPTSLLFLVLEQFGDHEIVKVARYSFSGPIPPKFEHKLRRHKQSFGKIATTVELDKDENLL